MSIKFCNFMVFKLVTTKLMYKSYITNDTLLFPPNLGDFIPQDAPARLISEIVDLMDLKEIHASYSTSSAPVVSWGSKKGAPRRSFSGVL